MHVDAIHVLLIAEQGGSTVAWGRRPAASEFCPVLGAVSGAAGVLNRVMGYLNFLSQSLETRGSLSTKDSSFGNPLPWALLCPGHGLDGPKDGRTCGGDNLPIYSPVSHVHTCPHTQAWAHSDTHTQACTRIGTQCSGLTPSLAWT